MITLENWLKKLQVRKINLKLMETAFTHRSYKGLGYVIDDYERLEFLGDVVIDLIISDNYSFLEEMKELNIQVVNLNHHRFNFEVFKRVKKALNLVQ